MDSKPCVKCGGTDRYARGGCKRCQRVRNRVHHNVHAEEDKAYISAYRKTHKDELIAYGTVYSKAHRGRRNTYQKTYDNTHKRQRNARIRERRTVDSLFRVKCSIRSRLRQALTHMGFRKGGNTESILGCSFEELKVYLEARFWPEMTWKNMGEWHIDHILPLSSATSESEVLKLSLFSNLQPLWADDNLMKQSRLDWVPIESHHLLPQRQS
jgi:hypothetical protein